VFARVAVATLVLNPALVPSIAMLVAVPFAMGLGSPHGDSRAIARQTVIWSRSTIRCSSQRRCRWPSCSSSSSIRQIENGGGCQHASPPHRPRTTCIPNVDALTISMARSAVNGLAAPVAARAIAVGVLSNMVVKLGIVSVVGRGPFRRIAAIGLIAMTIALATSLALIPL
jgi:hypothetical protein